MASMLVTGCSRWRMVVTDTPWVASNRQVTEWEKPTTSFIDSVFFMAPATYYETTWRDGDKYYDPYAIAKTTDDYLLSTAAGSSIVASRKPPPWKTIVSLDPVIALLVPSDSVKASKGWLLGTNHPVKSIGPHRYGPGYNYGSVVIFNEGVRWFSPDLRREPELVIFSTNGIAHIDFPGGSLGLVIKGEICKVTRE